MILLGPTPERTPISVFLIRTFERPSSDAYLAVLLGFELDWLEAIGSSSHEDLRWPLKETTANSSLLHGAVLARIVSEQQSGPALQVIKFASSINAAWA